MHKLLARVVAVGAAAALVWRFFARRHRSPAPRVVVGYDDGSALSLEPGSPERELLIDAATEALRA